MIGNSIKAWVWSLIGPTVLVLVLALVVGIGLMGALSKNSAANANAAADQAGSNMGSCDITSTGATGTAASGGAVASSASAPASAGAAPASVSAASAVLAAATSSLAPPELAAAENVAGFHLSAGQVQVAQVIVGVGKAVGMDHRGMQVALIVAQTDSGLNPAASINSGQIAGVFHQLTDQYPGVNLLDPVAASTSFYQNLLRLAEYTTASTDVSRVASAMQKPLSPFGFGSTAQVYATKDAWAKSMVLLLDTGTPTPAGAGQAGIDCITGLATVAVPGLTAAQAHNAQVIAAVGAARKLSVQAQTIAVCVAIAESTLENYANDGTSTDFGSFSDGHRELNGQERAVARQSLAFPHEAVGHNLDSMGLFQQRPSASWGTPAQLMDPATSAGKFYNVLVTVPRYDTSTTPWMIAQDVQGSNDSSGGIYATTYPQARAIVAALATATPPAGSGGGSGTGVVLVNGPSITLPAKAGLAGVITAPNAQVAKAISSGLNWLGEPYSWAAGNAAGPTLGVCGGSGAQNDCHVVGFDCSGLMLYMWAQVGISLPHYSQDQWSAGTQIPWAQREPGDMIGYPGHITMYIGTFAGLDYMLEAPESGEFVHVTPVRDNPGDQHYAALGRIWK